MTWPVALVALASAFVVGVAVGAVGLPVLVYLAVATGQRSSKPAETRAPARAGLN